jgi:uncharacterized membrane protein YjgN (DUF898 family)
MKALDFTGSGSEYFKIWIVNIMLIIVTLGLYYPWARVRNHRYFYGNTTLEVSNFEYHATGKQLFLAFFVAILLFIGYIVVQKISPAGSLIVLLMLLVAIPWLIWRSLIFSMKMTSFSNVRLGFKGTLQESYINFFLFPSLYVIVLVGMILLLGVFAKMGSSVLSLLLVMIVGVTASLYLFALIKKRNTSYVINGSRYGQGVFSVHLETTQFVRIAIKTILVSLLAFFITFFLIGIVAYGSMNELALLSMIENPEVLKENIVALVPLIIGTYVGMILGSIITIAYSTARQRTYIYENMQLDGKVSFASTLKARSYAWVMVSNFFLIAITLGLAFPWTKVRMARLMLTNTLVDTSVGFHDYVTQKQKEESSLGEQVGDMFDIDVGLGL